MRSELLVGAHMSIAGGLHTAIERGVQAGCRTVQIFLKNSNQWKARIITESDRDAYAAARDASGITPVMAHSSYLVNLASPDPGLYEKSLLALKEEMKRANFLRVPFLVLHPGAHVGSGEACGIERVAGALCRALESVEPPVTILLENTAGQGTCLGGRFEHLAGIIERTHDSERVGVCLDTCHLFASGYDIRSAEAYARTMREFDRVVGCRRIRAFHVNDSKRELGCRIDRHEHIGKGQIGIEAFRCLVNDLRFRKTPKILETPKGKDLQEDLMNLKVLRSLAAS